MSENETAQPAPQSEIDMIEVYVQDALDVYNHYRKLVSYDNDFCKLKENDKLKRVQSDHPKFAGHFPLVLRYMIQLGLFNIKAFRRFARYMVMQQKEASNIDSNVTPKKKGMDAYLYVQAYYVKCLYEETTPGFSKKQGKKIHDSVYESLKKEKDQFDESYQKAKSMVDDLEKRLSKERKMTIIKALMNNLDNNKVSKEDALNLIQKFKPS